MKSINSDVIQHYDLLIEENNDPVHDPKPLKDYMDKWDGQAFIDKMDLDKDKSVLEIGVGTGRLAVKTVILCKDYCGIDISPKTINKAKENLANHKNVKLICDDFLSHHFNNLYDVVYSSLTFMHIHEKQNAINKVACLLKSGGRFALSIDKSQEDFIDMGARKITIFPDSPTEIKNCILNADLDLVECFDTELAHIFVAKKVI